MDIFLIAAAANISLHFSLSSLNPGAFSLVSVTILNLVLATNFITQPAYADCVQDNDWPDRPCLDTPPYQKEELKAAWDQYYEYKGAAWMEMKKAEMDQAIDEDRLGEWVAYRSEPNNFANYNVYYYYYLHDQAPEVNDVGRIVTGGSPNYSIMIAAIAIAVIGTAGILLVLKKAKLA